MPRAFAGGSMKTPYQSVSSVVPTFAPWACEPPIHVMIRLSGYEKPYSEKSCVGLFRCGLIHAFLLRRIPFFGEPLAESSRRTAGAQSLTDERRDALY